MPSLLINTANLVLYDIEPGKTYITHPNKPKDQAAQKMGTCWYYADNLLRHRLGKEVESLKPLVAAKSDSDAEYLLAMRETEKNISAFRKKLTALDDFTSTVFSFPDCNKDEGRKLIPELKRNASRIKQKGKKLLEALELFTEQSEKNTLHSFIETRDLRKQIQYHLEFLAQLDPTFPRSEPSGYTFISKFSEIELLKYLHVLHSYAFYAIADSYGFKFSDWNLKSGFQGLLSALKNEGPLIIGGKVGPPYYSQSSSSKKSSSKIDKYDVTYWDTLFFKPKISTYAHTVAIIGVEKSDEGEYVYVIDPNNSSPANKKRIIHRVPYADIAEGISTFILEKTAFSAPKTSRDEIIKKYEETKKRLVKADHLRSKL